MQPADKLLSHRLRGFRHPENGAAALVEACRSGVPWLEIDVRVGGDGAYVVRHGPSARNPEFRLAEALAIFRDAAPVRQRLCIDLKDAGAESTLLREIHTAGVEHRVVLVSWIPHSLVTVHALDPDMPLVLSYLDVLRLGAMGAAIERFLAHRLVQAGRFVLIGREMTERPLGALSRGLQHALVSRGVPDGVASVLHASSGGVCVPTRLAGPLLRAFCNSRGLTLWIFTAHTPAEFQRLAAGDFADVVFCDVARDAMRGLSVGTRIPGR